MAASPSHLSQKSSKIANSPQRLRGELAVLYGSQIVGKLPVGQTKPGIMRDTFYFDLEQKVKGSANKAWTVSRFLIVMVKRLGFKFNFDKPWRRERKCFTY